MTTDLWNNIANLIETKRHGLDDKRRPWTSWEIVDDIRQMLRDELDM